MLLLLALTNTMTAQSTYKLKAISCKMAECYHPSNGFKFKSALKSTPLNGDSFIVDFRLKTFNWKDEKGVESYKMYDINKSSSADTFKTEHHFVRLMHLPNNSKVKVIGIIISVNQTWYYLEYNCNIS